MTKSLIALVATAVVVNGKRQIIPAGKPLPELDAADEKALLAAKAAQEMQRSTSSGEGDGAAASTAAASATAKGKK